MMGSVALRCVGLCLLAMCLLDRAVAFVVPSGRGVASFGTAPLALSHTASRQPTSARPRRASAVVMRESLSTAESSVAVYRKFIGEKRWKAVDDAENMATGVFEEICNVYGEENAVQMVKNSPSCLGYDPTLFRATFEAFSEVFTPEDTKGMVTRNPNLLAVRPTGFGGACNAKSDTMQMSYIIAFTRPLGPVLLGGLFCLLAIPCVEIATGIPREQFFSAFTS